MSGPVLAFHGVSDYSPAVALSGGLFLDTSTFERQLDQLLALQFHTARQYEIHSISDSKVTIAVTFDDVYENVLINAVPKLESAGFHFTLFLTAGYVDDRELFWWDVVRFAVLAAQDCEIAIGLWKFELGSPEAKQVAVARIEGLLSQLPRREREEIVESVFDSYYDVIHEQFGPVIQEFRPAKQDSVLSVAKSDLCSVQCHSYSHPFLPSCSASDLADEFSDSLAWFDSQLNVVPTEISFPFGGVSKLVLEMASEFGYLRGYTLGTGKQGYTVNFANGSNIQVVDRTEAASLLL